MSFLQNIYNYHFLFLVGFVIFGFLAGFVYKFSYYDFESHFQIADCNITSCIPLNCTDPNMFDIYLGICLVIDNIKYSNHEHYYSDNYNECNFLNTTIHCSYDDRNIKNTLTIFTLDTHNKDTLVFTVIFFVTSILCVIFFIGISCIKIYRSISDRINDRIYYDAL